MKPFHTKKNREIFDGIVVVILLESVEWFHHKATEQRPNTVAEPTVQRGPNPAPCEHEAQGPVRSATRDQPWPSH